MKKRVLSLFMALMLCLTLLPTAALAEEAGVVQDAANANSTYTTGENAGLTGGKDGACRTVRTAVMPTAAARRKTAKRIPQCRRYRELPMRATASAARTAAQRSTVMSMTRQSQRGMQPLPCPVLRAAII